MVENKKHLSEEELAEVISAGAWRLFEELFRRAFLLAGAEPKPAGRDYTDFLLECADRVLYGPENANFVKNMRFVYDITDKDLEYYHDYILYMLDEVNKYGPEEVLSFKR